jgi:hypothetical protein
MDRPSFGLAVLAATASLAVVCSSAYADTADSASDSGAATTPQIPQDDSTSPLSGGVSPEEGTPAADEPSSQAEEWGDDGAQEAGSSEETPAQTFTDTTGGEPTAPPAGSAPPGPAPPSTGDATAEQQIDEKATAPSGPPPAVALPVPPAAPVSAPPSGQAPARGTPAPVAPTAQTRTAPVAAASSTPASDGLKQLLTRVGRDLRTAQGQINGLRRGLDRGAPPRPSDLTRLRATLVRITPMLAAVQVRLDAAGRLSPPLRRLLHRVRSDLRVVRAAAAGLVVALRQSGARGHELRLLLRALESFRALGATFASTPGVNPAPSAPPTSPAHPQLQPAPAGSPVPADAEPPHPPAGGHRESPSRGVGGLSAESLWSAAPGAATASPGGSFSFAAAVALTMLLIGLAMPVLLARLDLPPGRRYSVALIAPLERPG